MKKKNCKEIYKRNIIQGADYFFQKIVLKKYTVGVPKSIQSYMQVITV